MQHLHPTMAQFLAPFAPPPANPAIQQAAAWRIVAEAFTQASPQCETCDHCSISYDAEPYGDGWAQRTSSECTLGDKRSDQPTDCPAYAAQQQDDDTTDTTGA